MQKKLIAALAVAGLVAAPAFAATSNVDVYGVMSFSVDYANTDDEPFNGVDEKDLVTARDNVSRIGFKGSEDLGGGLSAIWQIEMQLNADNANSVTTYYGSSFGNISRNTWRNTFVGLKSASMGTLILGRHDTPYKLATGKLDPFADTAADYNAIIGRSSRAGAAGLFDVRANQTIAYITPTWSGFHAAAAYVGVKNNESSAQDDNVTAWSVMAMYDNGPLFGSIAYERHNGILGANQFSSNGQPSDDISAWKLGLGYTFGNTKLGFIYEDISGGDNNGAAAGGEGHARSAWYLSGAHTMGNIVLKAAYGQAGDSDATATSNDGAKFWAIGGDYMLSKRTSVFGLYTKLTNDGAVVTTSANGGYDLTPYVVGSSSSPRSGNDPSVFSMGVKHTF